MILGFTLSPRSPFHHIPFSTMKFGLFLIFPSHLCCSAVELIMQNCVLISLWHLSPGLELGLLNIPLLLSRRGAFPSIGACGEGHLMGQL